MSAIWHKSKEYQRKGRQKNGEQEQACGTVTISTSPAFSHYMPCYFLCPWPTFADNLPVPVKPPGSTAMHTCPSPFVTVDWQFAKMAWTTISKPIGLNYHFKASKAHRIGSESGFYFFQLLYWEHRVVCWLCSSEYLEEKDGYTFFRKTININSKGSLMAKKRPHGHWD